MIVLALDQASQTSGFAIFNENKLVESGTFTFSGSLDKRLVKIRQKIETMVKQYGVTEIVLEDIQMEKGVGNNVVTYKALAEVIGVITELLVELKIPYQLIPASTWRSGLGIKGTQRAVYKKNAQDYVARIYKKQVPEDEADAICIGSHYIKNEKMSSAF